MNQRRKNKERKTNPDVEKQLVALAQKQAKQEKRSARWTDVGDGVDEEEEEFYRELNFNRY